MRTSSVMALVTLVVGAVSAFAIYTFGWHDNNGAPAKPAPALNTLKPMSFRGLTGSERLYTIRNGDVVRFPGTATHCQATGEGGQPQLHCVHTKRTRFQVVFNKHGVSVYDLRPPNDGFVSDFTLPGELEDKGE